MADLKLVISLNGERASVGVQAPGCDPIITVLQGDLGAVLAMVPVLVEEARQRWAQTPTYPKYDRPTPPTPPPQPVRTVATTPAPQRQEGRMNKLF